MRKILTIALTCATIFCFGQGKVLYSLLLVKPKIGQSGAFESSWKAHVAKFHNTDDKRQVYEILTGDLAGSYQLFEGPSSFADMDNAKSSNEAHDIDYEKNVATKLESSYGDYIYRFVDTLSYNGEMQADKYVNNIYNVKMGKMADLTAEIKRGMAVNTALKSPVSNNAFILQFGGSLPQLVIVSNLTDGFKQLDTEYRPGMNATFKAEYLKQFSQEQWDRRINLLQEICNSVKVQVTKFRKDLSSKL